MSFAERAAKPRIDAGVIDDARTRQRRHRNRWLLAGAASAAAATALSLALAGGGSTGRHDGHGVLARTGTERALGAGRDSWSFKRSEPAGVIVLARIATPRGVRASVDATIPGVAGVRFGTRRGPGPLSLSCVARGATNVCTQAVEWCPMPKATWRFNVTKLAGPPGQVRVDFVVAPRPSSA
jgi:hypothetical protein